MTHAEHTAPTPALSETMLKWLKLRRELEERITDPELRALLHEFVMLDNKLFEEEILEAFNRGVAARADI